MGTRKFHFAAVCAYLVSASLLLADEPPAISRQGNLLQQLKWLRVEVIGGRIAFKTDGCTQNRHFAEATPTEGSRQTLSLETKGHSLILRYEDQTLQESLLLEIDQRGQLTFQRAIADDPAAAVQYSQPPTGPVALSIGSNPAQRMSAADLWQLLLVHRAATSQHLLPALHRVRPNWDLAGRQSAIETSLLARSGLDVAAQDLQWRKWIEELSSGSFSRRQAADQHLRASGQAVLATLRQLDRQQLDVEQRCRIKSILADLADGEPDSPERVADWLVGEKQVWLALLAHRDLDQRVAAAEHLSKLCRRPLSYDPGATAEVRTQQLAELSAKLTERR